MLRLATCVVLVSGAILLAACTRPGAPTVTLAVLRGFQADWQATDWVIPRHGTTTAFPGEHAWQAALLRAANEKTRFHKTSLLKSAG